MKKLIALVAAVCSAAVVLAGDWVYTKSTGTVSDGTWIFKATLSGTKVSVNDVVTDSETCPFPTSIQPLDFSKPVTDGASTTYTISTINPHFGYSASETGWEHVGKPGVAEFVGALKLPTDDSLTSIGGDAFAGCVNATGAIVFPPNLKMLGNYAFCRAPNLVFQNADFAQLTSIGDGAFLNSSVKGDLDLSNLTTVCGKAFMNDNVTSVTFGPALTQFKAAYGGGPFTGNPNLAKITFDPASSVQFLNGFDFHNCAGLASLDLSCATELNLDNSRATSSSYSYFQGCAKLKKVVLGSKLAKLARTVFFDAPVLEEIHFYGMPPEILDNTSGQTAPLKFGKDSANNITCFVHLDENDPDYAEQKAAWDAYTQDGELKTLGSVWTSELVGNFTRPLILYVAQTVSVAAVRDADEEKGRAGLFTFSRSEEDAVDLPFSIEYDVSGSAVPGRTYAALGGVAVIPAGAREVTVRVIPLDDPEADEDTSVTVTIRPGDYTIAGTGTATVGVKNGASWGGWLYDKTAKTITRGDWTLPVALSGWNLTVTKPSAVPETPSVLDFSCVIVDADANAYDIVTLNPRFSGETIKNAVTGLVLPETPVEISGNSFMGCPIEGELDLTSATTVGANAFSGNSRLTSVIFGKGLKDLNGGYDAGSFYNCSGLKEVHFDPEGAVTIQGGSVFKKCSSLVEVDLTGVKAILTDNNHKDDSSGYPHFASCTSLRKVTLDPEIGTLWGRIFYNDVNLREVNFYGAPPTNLVASSPVYFVEAAKGYSLTTYVHLDAADPDYAAKKSAWDALTAEGAIATTGTHWSDAAVGEGLSATRPLLLDSVRTVSVAPGSNADPAGGTCGSFVISRGEEDPVDGDLYVPYSVGGTAVAGQSYGALPGYAVIPAGEKSVVIHVVPVPDPETQGDVTVVLTLKPGSYSIGTGTGTITVTPAPTMDCWRFVQQKEDWEGRHGAVTDGKWTFSALVPKNTMSIRFGAIDLNKLPKELTALDFSKFVTDDATGSEFLTITLLDTQFGYSLGAAGNYQHEAKAGIPEAVGELALPGEGLVRIANDALTGLTNATGKIAFPSTVKEVGQWALSKCGATIDGAKMPTASTYYLTYCFSGCTFDGMVDMTGASELESKVFNSSDVTDVRFGPGLRRLGSGYAASVFNECKSLTNVVFDAAASTLLEYGFTFQNLPNLETVVLAGVTNFTYQQESTTYNHFKSCPKLKKVVFGAGLKSLKRFEFNSCAALEEIDFLGLPPDDLGIPYLQEINKTQQVKTVIPRKVMAATNGVGMCWLDYSATGTIRYRKSTFKADYVKPDVTDLAMRLLVTDKPAPLMLIIR